MPAAIEFRNITKRFGAVQANVDVSFSIAKGTIHGLVGENGAGKSTLMSILYGYYRADGGQILLDGQLRQIRNSVQAIALGIGMVHQHFMLVDNFTVLDNVMLGAEGGFRLAGQRARTEAQLRALCARYRLDIDPLAKIEDLSVGAQQQVEILKQIYRNAAMLILDEPTAVLSAQETAALFDMLRRFREQGKTIMLISHKLQEIMDLTDCVTVMRGARVVGTVATKDTSKEALAQMMIGRTVAPALAHAMSATVPLPRTRCEPGAVVLDVRALQLQNRQGARLLSDIDFTLRAGEIVAIAGVSGNGQSQLLEILSGMRLPSAGRVVFQGADLPFAGRSSAEGLPGIVRRLGIAHVPEDRLRDGIIQDFSVLQNTVLGYQQCFRNGWGLLDFKAIAARAGALLKGLDVRPADPDLRIGLLSGGNQQKVVIAREMLAAPKLMLIGQPTRGVDIGTIETIHRQLLALRDAGVAILLVSVELDEVRALADRVLVMSGGRVKGDIRSDEFDATRIGLMMGGLPP